MSSTRCASDFLHCKHLCLKAEKVTCDPVYVQMPLNESNVVGKARRLLVYTIDAANFSDKMDIIFVAEMIEKIGKFVEKFKDVCKKMRAVTFLGLL